MTKKLRNIFMTIRGALTLRNLLAFLCALALLAVIVKGFRIEAKIDQVRQADALYAQNLRIPAEEAYAAALANGAIRYREAHIRERLAGLAPVTRLREEILKSKSELLSAAGRGDFDAFLTAYETYGLFGRLSLEGEWAAEYTELNERYELASTVGAAFSAFRADYAAELAANLEAGDYGDESAKWALLRIPAPFFADHASASPPASPASADVPSAEAETSKSESLNALLGDYDRRKLKKLAAAGQYDRMLDEAAATLGSYAQHGFDAPWVQEQAEETAGRVLRKELDGSSFAAFAGHARSFAYFASAAGLRSDLSVWIEARVGELAARADAQVADRRFREAIALYEALGGYADTGDAVARAESAWTRAEPLRILERWDSSHTYSFAVTGQDRFGADVYAAALDESGVLHYGTESGGRATVRSAPQELAVAGARGLALEESLSGGEAPVFVAESESTSRRAVYTALLARSDSLDLMFRIEADGYTIENGGQTLRANHPIDADEDGQTAVYERSGDVFSFVELEGGTLDIGGGNPASYPGQQVSARLTVLESGYGQARAQAEDGSRLLLRGSVNFEPGTYEVTGVFEGNYEIIAWPEAAEAAATGSDAPSVSDDVSPSGDGMADGAASPDEASGMPAEPGATASEDAAAGSGTAEQSAAGTVEEGLASPETDPGGSGSLPAPVAVSVPVFEVDAARGF